MASSTRSRALSLFKTLHRSVQTVFRGDLRAMLIARDKIEAEFRKNRNLTDQGAIEELLKHGADCNKVFLTQMHNYSGKSAKIFLKLGASRERCSCQADREGHLRVGGERRGPARQQALP